MTRETMPTEADMNRPTKYLTFDELGATLGFDPKGKSEAVLFDLATLQAHGFDLRDLIWNGDAEMTIFAGDTEWTIIERQGP